MGPFSYDFFPQKVGEGRVEILNFPTLRKGQTDEASIVWDLCRLYLEDPLDFFSRVGWIGCCAPGAGPGCPK